MDNKLNYFQDLLNSCFLPELKQDLDSFLIEKEHFAEYHKVLGIQLPVLFDFIQQHEVWILKSDEAKEMKSYLTLLLCELTAHEAIYYLDEEHLNQAAIRLLNKHYDQLLADPNIELLFLEYYQRKLHKDKWKRNLACIHGFFKFLQNRYTNQNNSNCKITNQWMTFCLAVGLNVRECHEPAYKQMGLQIFLIILQQGNSDEIKQMNIHCVIYDDAFRDVHSMELESYVEAVWNCLLKCLDYFEQIDSTRWSQLDDMMDTIIRNISLTSDSSIALCLLQLITKMCVYFSINCKDIESHYNCNLSDTEALQSLRIICAENNSYTSFRFAKNILNMLVLESHRLMQSKEFCIQFLQAMHVCYLVCTEPIPLRMLEPHLPMFFEKFTSVLMDVIGVQGKDVHIIKSCKSFVQTFYLYLLHSEYCEKSEELLKYRKAFQQLLEQPIFC